MWLLTTALPLGVYLLMAALPRLDPRRRLDGSNRSLHKLTLLLVGCLSGLACYSLYLAQHPGLLPGRELHVGLALFVALLGNYLTTVQPNYFLGVRTPWTLQSDQVWTQTHRLTGWLLFGVGLASVLLALLGPEEWFQPVFLGLVLGIVLLSLGYSYWAYQQQIKKLQL
ncbi:hypothetical protein GCM10023185_21800 [Hymenobacter saemangeumensis]|uniref:SdpI family protein n=1 Tax=Hymenobacter saemangeumensis TaxID=1084522 RepID=A0ABP8IF74_9BACT